MERLLCPLVGFVVLRPGCLLRQPGLGHQPPDVAVAMIDVELFGEVLARERNRPRGDVNTDLFGRFVKSLDELLVLGVGKVG